MLTIKSEDFYDKTTILQDMEKTTDKRDVLAAVDEMCQILALRAPKPLDPETPLPLLIGIDGACRNNQAADKENTIGACSAIIEYGSEILGVALASRHCTNNRQELLGLIRALRMIVESNKFTPISAKITTDSTYIYNGVTQWLPNWRLNDFRNVKNTDLWKVIEVWLREARKAKCEPKIRHVRGHIGDQLNEAADTLCNMAMDAHTSQVEIAQTIVILHRSGTERWRWLEKKPTEEDNSEDAEVRK